MIRHYRWLPVFLLSILLIGCCPKTYLPNRYLPADATPEQIVEHYQETFGTPRMDEIGPYTTANFRNNQPIAVWITKTWDILQKFEYEMEAFKILETEYNADNTAAKITAAAKIKTAAANATQKDIYLLIKQDGRWLLDDLIVTDEVLDEEVFEL